MATLRWRFARSGLVTALGLLLLLSAVTALYMAHMHGRIHQLTTVTEHDTPAQVIARPGGQDVLRLFRAGRIGSTEPEFSSATLLPGDGMLMLQSTLLLPGRGDVPIMQGTPLADLSAAGLNIAGAPFSVLVQSRTGTQWTGPVEALAGRPASKVSNDVVPGGSRAIARFAVGPSDAGASQQQGIDITVESSVTEHGLDLTIAARNTSASVRALTIAWQPRFLAPQAGLSALTVTTPAGADRAATDLPLGSRNVDESYTDLKHRFLSTGPEVRLRNRADGYTLRMTALTPSIHGLHVQAAKDGQSVLLAFSTAGGQGADARTIVAPGETLQWRVRVEALADSASNYAQ